MAMIALQPFASPPRHRFHLFHFSTSPLSLSAAFPFGFRSSNPAVLAVFSRFLYPAVPTSIPSMGSGCPSHFRAYRSSSGSFSNSSPSPDVLRKWQNAEAVCFDVDSTVCMDEGIDELANFCGAGDAVASWTSRAMGGSVPFEEALTARLNLFKPSLKDVERFLASHPPRVSPGIQELVKKIQSQGIIVYLVSGGFRQMIAPVGALLQIPEERIFANRLLFDNDGEFIGFDVKEPTSRSGGKAAVIAQIKQTFGHKTLVMVGDGATDLEARKPGGADLFICYGGVQIRPNVAAEADWFILSFSDLIETLDKPSPVLKP